MFMFFPCLKTSCFHVYLGPYIYDVHTGWGWGRGLVLGVLVSEKSPQIVEIGVKLWMNLGETIVKGGGGYGWFV